MKRAAVTLSLAAILLCGVYYARAQPPNEGRRRPNDRPSQADRDRPPPPDDRPGGGGGGGGRPRNPLLIALDTDGDGELSAEEIANAPKSLLKLDKNGDGKLSRDEMRPPQGPEGGARGPGEEQPRRPADGDRQRRPDEEQPRRPADGDRQRRPDEEQPRRASEGGPRRGGERSQASAANARPADPAPKDAKPTPTQQASTGPIAGFMQIPAGEFDMGDHHNLGGQEHASDEVPIHRVRVDSFCMAVFPTTNEQYCAFLNGALAEKSIQVQDGLVYSADGKVVYCDTNASDEASSIGFKAGQFTVVDQRAKHPAVCIRWHGAAACCNWLTQKNGGAPLYDPATWQCDYNRKGFRLPTEAEWEYAGRGGLNGPYYIFPWGDDPDFAKANWPRSCDPYEAGPQPWTTPVGFYNGQLQRKADFHWPGDQETYQTANGVNGFGLYDMAGNVWQWVNDWYDHNYYSASPSDNPHGPDAGQAMRDGKPYRTLRGGSWYNGQWGHSRVSNRNPSYYRGPDDPNHRWYHIGFRLVLKTTDIAAPAATSARATATPGGSGGFTLRSPVVAEGGTLPKEFTGDGDGATPPLEWSGAPAGTKSYAVIMHHLAPDAVRWYWVLYNIPADVSSLPKNVKGIGVVGSNSANREVAYAPPHSRGPGEKKYTLTVYALSAEPQITVPPAEVNRDKLLAAMKDLILGSAELNVVYTRDAGAMAAAGGPQPQGERRADGDAAGTPPPRERRDDGNGPRERRDDGNGPRERRDDGNGPRERRDDGNGPRERRDDGNGPRERRDDGNGPRERRDDGNGPRERRAPRREEADLRPIANPAPGGHTVGLIKNSPQAFPGYTLFAPKHDTMILLMDNEGRAVHRWDSQYEPGQSVYLLDNAHLLHCCFTKNKGFTSGGEGGRLEEFDWDGKLVWEFEYSTDQYLSHHDIKPLPNGNVLILAVEKKSYEEAIAAGFNPQLLRDRQLFPEFFIEVEPTRPKGGKIVWEWHVWDHLIQDNDRTKANFGDVAAHPELIDVNCNGRATPAFWNHGNSIAYNAELDQIMLSARGCNEIWVVDHGGTTAEAASHTGGKRGKGGDLLYRWGNPAAYGRGTSRDRQLFQQHDAQWIPQGCPGAGHILIFNNGLDRGYSTIEEIVPPMDERGNYVLSGQAPYGPEKSAWRYQAQSPEDFYSSEISGAHRLPNGNTLICAGVKGTFFEVTPQGETVWQYVNPVVHNGILAQGELPGKDHRGHSWNAVFKIHRYELNHLAFAGKDLKPMGPIEQPAEMCGKTGFAGQGAEPERGPGRDGDRRPPRADDRGGDNDRPPPPDGERRPRRSEGDAADRPGDNDRRPPPRDDNRRPARDDRN